MIPDKVQVQIRPSAGTESMQIFHAVGAAQFGSENYGIQHGGVIFAYSSSEVRLWAPTDAGGWGRITSIYDGWGQNNGDSRVASAEVRVRAWKSLCPILFDSGWVRMESQAEQESFREVKHNLGFVPWVQIATRYNSFVYEGFEHLFFKLVLKRQSKKKNPKQKLKQKASVCHKPTMIDLI